MSWIAAPVLKLIALAACTANPAVSIEGEYLEARTADVFTGPCFSNSEIWITGHQAVLAWKVKRGTWEGVDLSGLTVAAAVVGTTTLSKDDPSRARAVLIVDQAASPEQKEALIKLARNLGGVRMQNIVEIRFSVINFLTEDHPMSSDGSVVTLGHHSMPKTPIATFWAPGLAEITTRPLDETDHFCGNEVVEYQPLSHGVRALPAYTLSNVYRGESLNTTWDDHNCRSSFVGTFTR